MALWCPYGVTPAIIVYLLQEATTKQGHVLPSICKVSLGCPIISLRVHGREKINVCDKGFVILLYCLFNQRNPSPATSSSSFTFLGLEDNFVWNLIVWEGTLIVNGKRNLAINTLLSVNRQFASVSRVNKAPSYELLRGDVVTPPCDR